MNCRSLKIVAVAVAFCVVSAVASNALAAKEKGHHGVVKSVTEAVEAKGTSPAVAGTIKVMETDKTGTSTTTTYDLSDSVSVQVNGEPAKLSDLKEGDKIGFTLSDNKIATIKKGHKAKKSS